MDVKKDFETTKTLGWGKPSYLNALQEMAREERPGYLRIQKVESKKFGVTVGDKIEAFFKKREEEKEAQKEKKVDYWESTINKIQETNSLEDSEDTVYDTYHYELRGVGEVVNFVKDTEKRKSTRELKIAKSVGRDMKQHKWVVIDYNSWNSLVYVYPWAKLIIKSKNGIGIGMLIDVSEFATCIQKATDYGLNLFWRNEFHEKDNLLIIRELTVAPKSEKGESK